MNDGFQFFNIDFIENDFFEYYEPNETGDVVTINTRHFRLRSVITFDTIMYTLEESDYQNMRYLQSAFGFESMEHLYTNKIKVFSDNRYYWFYVQTEVEQFINGQKATIRYYPIGINRKLFLIGIGFFPIQ